MTEEGFEDFLRERRERAERTRHLLVSVLAVTCIALAVSNVVLAFRLASGRARQTAEAPARAVTGTEAPARPSGVTEPPRDNTTSARTATDEAPPAVTLPKTSEPVQPDAATPRAASPPSAEPPARADAAPPAVATRPSDAVDLPPRASVAPTPTRRTPSSRGTTPSPSALPAPTAAAPPAAPEEATAAWMLTTYGRADAEARARAALDFYDPTSTEGRYWRRVLGLIVVAR